MNHQLGRAIRIHDYHKALKLLTTMKDERVVIEPHQYDMVLRLYCDEEMLKGADRLLGQMEFMHNLHIVHANAVLHAHCKTGNVQEALSFFKKMKADLGLKHDEQSYLEVIRLMTSQKTPPTKVLEMMHKMELEGITPTVLIYSDVIYYLALCHKYKEAREQFHAMKGKSIEGDTILYNLMLEIGKLSHDQALMKELVVEMWERGMNIHPLVYDSIRHLEKKMTAPHRAIEE
jgi:pentatricopeptide repeat protein